MSAVESVGRDRTMSTVMHCYRIKREDWWGFAAQVRDYYLNDNLMKTIIKKSGAEISGSEVLRLAEFMAKHEPINLQIFEENDGRHYLIRVLELGYRFMNNYAKQGWPVKPVFYDNRTDLSPEEEANKETAEWIDEMISQRRYLIYPIIADADDWFQIVWDWKREAAEKRKDDTP